MFRRSIAHNQRLFLVLKATSALGFFYPIWFLYEQQYISLVQIALLEAIIVGVQLLLEIPTGAVADLFGYKISVFTGHLVQSLSLIVFLYARNFPAFIIYAVILGLGEALKSGAEEALEYDSLKAVGKEDQYAKYKSWYSLSFQLSLAFAFIVGGAIGQTNMVKTIWMTVGALFVSSLVAALLVEPPLERKRPNFNRYFRQLFLGWHELTKDRPTRLITFLYLAVGTISWTTNLSLLNMYLVQINFSPTEIGWVLGLIRIINIVVLIKLIKRLIQPELNWRIYLFFTFLFGAGYIPAAFFAKWPAASLIGLILISTTARWIILGNYLNRRLNSKNRATALSTASMGISLGHMLIMASSATLLPLVGGPKHFISLLGILGAISCVVLFWLSLLPTKAPAYTNHV